MAQVLVISPHPDDEAIGCGGAIRRHALAGDEVHVVFLTSGERGGHGRDPAATARLREREALDAAEVLGTAPPSFWRLPDGGVRAGRDAVLRLRETVARLAPATLYAPWERDGHPDHRAAFRMVRAALAGAERRPHVLGYEVWTPLGRVDHVVDISDLLETKLAAIRAHRSQCEAMRFDDAASGLARYRGEMFCWPKDPGGGTGVFAEVFRAHTG